ncbi:MAG: hypothetical protein K6C34_03810 [Alphaproteobacteria bacterium]|nr:hypothetical protein [Alphaproteobacteria bacterium]
MKKILIVALLISVYYTALCLKYDVVCRYQNEEGYPMPLYTRSNYITPMGQMYPLAVAAHAYNGENYFGPVFSADFELDSARRAYFSDRLHTDITSDVVTLSIQMAESAHYGTEQVALKSQWAFFNDVPLTRQVFDVGSTVECHVIVTDETSSRELYFPPTYVNIHGDANPYVYRLSSNTYHSGFNAIDDKTRGVLYSVKFSGGKGAAAALNGKVKTGLLILNGKTLAIANEDLNACVGKTIGALDKIIQPCGQDETLSILGIK